MYLHRKLIARLINQWEGTSVRLMPTNRLGTRTTIGSLTKEGEIIGFQ